MSERKWTPGPWRAAPFSSIVFGCPISAQPDPTKNTIIVAGTRSAVADDAAGFRREVEANARLLAAAPALYEALKNVLLDIDFTIEAGHLPDVRNDIIYSDARAALALARGDQS